MEKIQTLRKKNFTNTQNIFSLPAQCDTGWIIILCNKLRKRNASEDKRLEMSKEKMLFFRVLQSTDPNLKQLTVDDTANF